MADILHFLEQAGANIARPFVATGADVSNAIGNAEVRAGQAIGLKANTGVQTNQQQFGNTVGNYVGSNTPMHFLENAGQVGLAVGTGGIGDAAAGAVGLGDIGGAAGAAIKGAAGGTATGGAFNALGGASQGQTSAKDLTMNFLTGTAGGVVLGAAGGAVSSVAKTIFGQSKLQDMAENENVKQVEKDLTPHTGPVIAQKIAPAITQSKDPEIVSNIIDNSLKQHLPETPKPAVGNEVTPAQTPPPETPEANFEGPELQAQRGMQEILNRGGTVDEALNHHMETTGGSFGDAQRALSAVRGAVGTDVGHINASLNPEWGKLQIPQADSDERAILNSRMVRNQATRAANAASAEIDKLNPNDLKLMDDLRTTTPEDLVSQAKDKQQFMKAATLVKKFNDTVHALGAGQLEQDVPYRQNYGAPLMFDRSTPEAEQAYQENIAKLPTTPGYGKERYFKNYEDASQISNGQLKRANENFLGDFMTGAQKRISDLSQLTLAKGLQQVHPGEVNVGQIGTGEGGTYTQLQIPGGSKISLPSDIANEINKRAPALEPGGKLAKYDALNSNLKNFKLAGGGFHSLNVLGSYLGQQIASGKLFTPKGIGDLGDVIHTTFSQKAFDSTLDDMGSRGKLTDADAAGLKYGRGETQGDVHATGKLQNIPVLKQIHSSIFDRQIPMLKLKIFDQLTQDMSRNNPDDLAKMTSIAKELNQNFGGINREIQGLNYKQFQVASRAFLSTDYNEGQLESLYDAFRKGGPEGKLARQVVFGKALLFGGLATAGGAAGGEFQGKTPQQTAFDILEKFANPEFQFGQYKVGLPTTQIAEVAKPIQQTIQGYNYNKSLTEGVQNFATNRLAAVPSEALQVLGNKNYLGQPIRGVDTHGRPISPVTTAENVASGVVPIPVSQAGQTATGNQSIGAAIANTIGLRTTATNQVSKLPVDQQTYIQTLQKELPSTWNDKQKSEVVDAITNFDSIVKQNYASRQKVDTQISKDIANGDMTKAEADADAFNQQLYKSISKAINSSTAQYLNIPLPDQQTPYQYLTGNTYGYFTNLNVSSRKKTINRNPTKYGLKIGERV